jgi:hypothetical protein
MAKQRTREQKQRALQRRQQQAQANGPSLSSVPKQSAIVREVAPSEPVGTFSKQSSFSAALSQTLQKRTEPSSSSTQSTTPNLDLQQFFGFNPRLIYADLTKTIVVSAVLLVLLLVFSWLVF